MDERDGSETRDESVIVVESAETPPSGLGELVQRGQAAKLAGVSRSTLWRLQHEGVLRPTETSPQGWALFRLEDVLAVCRTRNETEGRALVVAPSGLRTEGTSTPHAMPPADLCAQVFDLFEAGKDGAAVVRTLRTVGPDQVLALRDKWMQLKGTGVLVSHRSVQRLVSAGLAIPRENARGELCADSIQDEAMLIEAIARALDARQGLCGPRATSAADVTRWLSVRFVPGAEGQCLWLSAMLHDCGGESWVKTFRGEEWSCVEALGRAVFDEAMHAQRKNESFSLRQLSQGGGVEPVLYTGNYALKLETPHGGHRYWLSLETVAVGELTRSLRESSDALRGRQMKKRLEHEREQETERKAKRKEAAKERERIRREEANERAKERTRERTEDLKQAQQMEREMRAAGLLGDERSTKGGA